MSDFRGRKISGLHEYFFDGYEEVEYIDEKGKTRRRLDYHGKIYSFRMSPEQMKQLRIRFAVLAALIFAVLIFAMLHMSGLAGSFPGAFMVIGILPHFYYTFGMIRFMFLKEEFNNRRLYQSYKRMENGVFIKMGIAGLSLLLCVLFLIFNKNMKLDPDNIITVAAGVAFGVLALLERRLISQNRYVVIRDKDRVVVNADVSKGEKEAKPKAKSLSEYYATAQFFDEEEEEEPSKKEKRAERRRKKKEAAAQEAAAAQETPVTEEEPAPEAEPDAEETSDPEPDGTEE